MRWIQVGCAFVIVWCLMMSLSVLPSSKQVKLKAEKCSISDFVTTLRGRGFSNFVISCEYAGYRLDWIETNQLANRPQ